MGASTGIGRSIAEACAGAGAERLLLLGRDVGRLDQTAATSQASGATAITMKCDVTDAATVHAAFSQMSKSESPPQVVVNCAGVPFTKMALDVEESEWDEVMNVHVKGTFLVCQAAASMFIPLGYGKIVNLSSTWAYSADHGKSVYSAAKAAVSQLTAALAVEWADLGIRVNAIAPCTTATSSRASAIADPKRGPALIAHIPMGRVAVPEDVAAAAVFLASEASDFITGHTLMVDGGWRAKS